MKWSEEGGNCWAVRTSQKDPRSFGFSLAIRRSLGLCAPWVCGAEGGLRVWGEVPGVLAFTGETPVSKPSPDVYTVFRY